MSDGDRLSTDLQESAEDLRSYLADGIPPLLAADGIGLLVRRNPEALTAQVQAWLSVHHQARGGALRFADLAFHVLRKLHVLGELGLLPKRELAPYLASLVETLVPLCSPEDRELVRTSLDRLRLGPKELSSAAFAAGPASARGPAGARGEEDGGATSAELTRELRRFALLLARIRPGGAGGAAGAPADAPREELVPALLSAAAVSARDASELGKYLEHLRRLGVAQTDPAGVVRALSRALPAWAPAEAPAPEAQGSGARALHRFVELADEPMQRLARFEEVVGSLVDEHNAGSLARAVALVQVAAGLLAEQRVPLGDAEGVLSRAQASLDIDRLRTFALDPQHHALLRQLMAFFPGLRPEGLLADLEDEPDRILRRLRLTLVEVHGAAARPAILERMEGALADMSEVAWFWQRNLVYLLHRIPCPPDAREERELDYVLEFSQLAHHPRVVGEAVVRLGQIPHEGTLGALLARLREVEAGIAAGGLPALGLEDLERLRALIAVQLLRGGAPAARRAVVQGALRRLREAGDADRLVELRGFDLSAEPELVDEVLEALREALPRKLMGVTLRRNTEVLTQIVESLASTPTVPVRRTLEELARGFSREPFGIEASKVLAAFDAPPPAGARTEAPAGAAPAAPPAQRMEGDLQLFGLPNLLQSLAQNELSGTLTLRDAQGARVAVLELRKGDLTFCSTGRLQGEPAFYQLLERPVATAFTLEGGETSRREAAGSLEPARGLLRLLMEGMRRYDEYERARALVPDPTVLLPTGTRPSTLPGETDGVFVRDLWSQVKSGAPAAACEEALAADAFRVRTLLAHWLAEGAVEVSQFDAVPLSSPPPPTA